MSSDAALRKARSMIRDARRRYLKNPKKYGYQEPELNVELIANAIRAGCPFTGRAFSLTGPWTAMSPSLDRQNPKLGYTHENTRVVPVFFNVAAGNFTSADLRFLAPFLQSYLEMREKHLT